VGDPRIPEEREKKGGKTPEELGVGTDLSRPLVRTGVARSYTLEQ
jgi:hypothetical protein